MSLTKSFRPGGRHGLSSKEFRDPIGFAVAALGLVARSDLIDRIGLRRQTEQAVFTVTRGGFRTLTSASRTFTRRGTKGAPGVRVPGATRPGVFDLTPTEDEQMLVDVVSAFADEVVRPAAAEANERCAAPEALLEAGREIGLPILGIPESLGGISEERSAMAGTLVAEALARGDMGLAVAALAPGAVATAIGLWGTDEQQSTYLPAFTGDDVPAAALALNEPTVLFDVLSPSTTATKTAGGYVLNGVKTLVPLRRGGRPLRPRRSSSRATPSSSSSRQGRLGSRSRATPRWGSGPPRSRGSRSPTSPCRRTRSSAPPTARRTSSACGSPALPGVRWPSAPARPCSTT